MESSERPLAAANKRARANDEALGPADIAENVAADTGASSGQPDGRVCSLRRVQESRLDCIVQSGPDLLSRAGLESVYRTYLATSWGKGSFPLDCTLIAVKLHFDCSFGRVVRRRGWAKGPRGASNCSSQDRSVGDQCIVGACERPDFNYRGIDASEPVELLSDSGARKLHLLIGLGGAACQCGLRMRHTISAALVNQFSGRQASTFPPLCPLSSARSVLQRRAQPRPPRPARRRIPLPDPYRAKRMRSRRRRLRCDALGIGQVVRRPLAHQRRR